MAKDEMKILLASKSPRRRALLKELIDDFSVTSADVDEAVSKNSPEEIVMALSLKKAESVEFDGLVIASDTLVFDCDTPLGKPIDESDAFNMLSRLSGRVHQVYSGVCLKSPTKTVVFYDKTDVEFKTLTRDDILYYIMEFNPLDKAGAYGIQDGFCVKSIVGSYSSVMGLPLEKLRDELIALGVKVKE